MTPAAGIGLDVARVESDSFQLQKLIGEWRSIAPLYYGDFYPLTPYGTEPTSWIAWQFDSSAEDKGHEQDKGVIQAFRRPESPFETARFHLRGLSASASYAIRDLDTGEESRHTGKELVDTGLQVSIRNHPGVAILAYRRIE